MRKVIVNESLSLDGVAQAPGGPEEDPSGGFVHGGRHMRYMDVDAAMQWVLAPIVAGAATAGLDRRRPRRDGRVRCTFRRGYRRDGRYGPVRPARPSRTPRQIISSFSRLRSSKRAIITVSEISCPRSKRR
jgi:hypothetical protein